MGKIFSIMMILLVILMFCGTALAVGPLMVSAHQTVCDRNMDTITTGYYIYWRVVTTPVNPWVNAQRSPILSQPATGSIACQYDLMSFNLPNGNYEVMATAINAAGDESGPSNIVPFTVAIPASPTSLRKQ